ncbi:MAG: hypothetical protein ACM359_18285 [Bacillota bacterium]
MNDLDQEFAALRRELLQLKGEVAALRTPRQSLFLARDGDSSMQWRELAFEDGVLADHPDGRACTDDADASALVALAQNQFAIFSMRDGINTRYVKISGASERFMAKITGGNENGYTWAKLRRKIDGTYEPDPAGPTDATEGYQRARECNGRDVTGYGTPIVEMTMGTDANGVRWPEFEFSPPPRVSNSGVNVEPTYGPNRINIPSDYALGGEFAASGILMDHSVDLKLYGLTIKEGGVVRGSEKLIYTLNFEGASVTASGNTATITLTGSGTQIVGMTITGLDCQIGGTTSASCTTLSLPTGLSINDDGSSHVTVHMEVYGDWDVESAGADQFIQVVDIAPSVEFPAGGLEILWAGFWLQSYASQPSTQLMAKRCKTLSVGKDCQITSPADGECILSVPLYGDGTGAYPGCISILNGAPNNINALGRMVKFNGITVNEFPMCVTALEFTNCSVTYVNGVATIEAPTGGGGTTIINTPLAIEGVHSDTGSTLTHDCTLLTLPNGISVTNPDSNHLVLHPELYGDGDVETDESAQFITTAPIVPDYDFPAGGIEFQWLGAWANLRNDGDQPLTPFRLTHFDFGYEFNLVQDATTPTQYKVTLPITGDAGNNPDDPSVTRTGAIAVYNSDGQHGRQVRWLGFTTQNAGVAEGSAYNIKTLSIPAASNDVLAFTARPGNIAELGLKPGTLGQTAWHNGTKWTISCPRLSVYEGDSVRSTYDTETFIFSNATVTHDSVTHKTTVTCGGGSLTVQNGGAYLNDAQGNPVKATILNIEGNGTENVMELVSTGTAGKVNLRLKAAANGKVLRSNNGTWEAGDPIPLGDRARKVYQMITSSSAGFDYVYAVNVS